MGPTEKTVRVLFLNNAGTGLPVYLDVTEGTSLGEFLARNLEPGQKETDFRISVNRQIEARDYTLKAGDRVTCMPQHVKGA